MATPVSPYRKHTQDKTFLSLDFTASFLKSQILSLRSLTNLFQNSNTILENIGKNLNINSEQILYETTTNNAINLIILESNKIAEICNSQSEILHKNIFEPYSAFEAQYENLANNFQKDSKIIFNELIDYKKQAEKDKENYFKTLQKLDKSQKILKGIIADMENGKEFESGIIETKTSIF